MFNVSKEGIISISRGDNFSVRLFINAGNDLEPIRYKLNLNDELYFALMSPNQTFENALLIKKYSMADLNSYGDVTLKFESKDTEFLLPGKYYYQLKLKINKEDNKYEVNTIIPMTEFYIEE